MTAVPTVAVLVSAGRHQVSGLPRACRGDAVAMAFAQKLGGGATRVVHAGGAQDPALQDYLAFGAGRIEALCIDASDDPIVALASCLRHADIIVTGIRAETRDSSGLVPYKIAQLLKRPVVVNVLTATIENAALDVQQHLPKGQRRRLIMPMPAVIAVHPRATVDLKYAHARRVSGHIDVITPALSEAHAPETVSTIDHTPRRLVRLQASDHRSGHERMQSLIETEARGGAVAFEGTSVDKAQILLTYLRENQIVDF